MAIEKEDLSDLDAILADLDELLEGYNGIGDLARDDADFLAGLQLAMAKEGYNYSSDSAGTYLDKLWKAGYGLRDLLKAMRDDVERVLNGEE